MTVDDSIRDVGLQNAAVKRDDLSILRTLRGAAARKCVPRVIDDCYACIDLCLNPFRRRDYFPAIDRDTSLFIIYGPSASLGFVQFANRASKSTRRSVSLRVRAQRRLEDP